MQRAQTSLCWPIFLVTALAATQLVYAQTAKKPFDVIVKTVDNDGVGGQLQGLSLRDGLILHTSDNDEQHIPTHDLVSITQPKTNVPTRTRDVTLTLVRGDFLHGRLIDGDDEAVTIETVDLGRLSIPLEMICGIDSAQAHLPAYKASTVWFHRSAGGQEDQILLTNGDVVRGFVTAIDAKGVSIESSLGETTIPHTLALAVRLISPPPQVLDRPYMAVTFHNSGRMTVTNLNWSGSVVEAELPQGQRAAIEAERVVRIDVTGGRWEWLSQHQPISYQHTPMLSMDWDYVADRNVLGEPIIVDSETFEHGIGVHSRSSLTYDLKGIYTQFVTSFGMDDNSGPYADVSVAILVDGKLRFDHEHAVRGQLVGPIRLDVTKAKRVELVADFGENGDLQDRFNWIEPALVR
ncbi:MAG: NPCBM/NEW2 domain-containing protein [Phycisphaerales bacterium]|nr:MAG: NPCBM/NEW2 domain-containing protein [Phycisphaerales bacterium]